MVKHLKTGCALLLAQLGLAFVPGIGLTAASRAEEVTTKPAPLEFTGVNLAGGEFGEVKEGKARVYGKQFVFPSVKELDYFATNGMNIIRFPFRWEDLQPQLNQPLNTDILDRVVTVVTAAQSRGMVTILDPHNYARYLGVTIGSPKVPNAAFADFWRRLATRFKNDSSVWFGLMNEPHDMPNEQWLSAANAAIAAIREIGATNLILVPGNAWTGAHSWVSSKNAEVMLGVRDPKRNYMYDVHQYLDKDSSGTHTDAVRETIGRERLEKFTTWCRNHKQRAFLGETAAADNPVAAQAMDQMLTFMEENRDVWAGSTWWAAGPWWGNYMFSLQPKDGKDRPQMKVLRPHLQPR